MKKSLLLVAVLATVLNSQPSNALIIGDHGSSCYRKDSLGCVMDITISLPTLIIGSSKELSEEERAEFVVAEARNYVEGVITESVLLDMAASQLGKDVRTVANDILESASK